MHCSRPAVQSSEATPRAGRQEERQWKRVVWLLMGVRFGERHGERPAGGD